MGRNQETGYRVTLMADETEELIHSTADADSVLACVEEWLREPVGRSVSVAITDNELTTSQ